MHYRRSVFNEGCGSQAAEFPPSALFATTTLCISQRLAANL